jgi:hypothetical protein
LGSEYQRVAFCYAYYFLLWAKGLNANDIHKEMFPVCGGKCLLHKAGHSIQVETEATVQ